jgi:hypothetical protein
MKKFVLVLVVLLLIAGCATKEKAAQGKGKTFLRLTPDEYQKMFVAADKGRLCKCVERHYECIPGCDPPEENGTIHGCSSCYTRYVVCDRWECNK